MVTRSAGAVVEAGEEERAPRGAGWPEGRTVADEIGGLPGPVRSLLAVVGVAQVAFAGVYLYVALSIGEDMPGLLDLDRDGTVHEWWSAMLLAGAAAIAIGIRHWCRDGRSAWLAIGLALAFLSMDEVAGVHEAVGRVVGEESLGISGRAIWPVVYLPAFAAIGVLLFLRTRRERGARVLVGAGLVCVTLAVLAEGTSGVLEQNETSAGALRGSLGTLTPLEVVVEESLESIGFGLILAGLLVLFIRLHAMRFRPRS